MKNELCKGMFFRFLFTNRTHNLNGKMGGWFGLRHPLQQPCHFGLFLIKGLVAGVLLEPGMPRALLLFGERPVEGLLHESIIGFMFHF